MFSCRTVSISINAPYDDVYEFAHQPQNFEKWSEGLTTGLHPRPDGAWIAETSLGHLEITFTPPNGYGIIDHTVHFSTGPVYVPLRILKNGAGVEVVLTVFRPDDMSDAIFTNSVAKAAQDLLKLKTLIEGDQSSVVHVDFSSRMK